MKEIWSSNLASLEKSNIELASAIRKSGFIETDRYQIMRAPKGDHFLDGGHIVSSSPSEENLKNLFKDLPFPQILLFCGFSSESSIRNFLKTDSGKDAKHILIVDRDVNRFSWILSQVDLSNFFSDSRITFFIDGSTDDLFNQFFNWLRIPERAFRMSADLVITNENLSESDKNFFDTAADEWNAAKKQIQRHFGGREDSLLGLKYVVENFSSIEVTPGISDFKGKFKGIPAVIASTGPSLERSLSHLRAIQNNCLIFAADASLNILLENGIEPHISATLERDLYSKKFFEKSSSHRKRLKTHLVSYPFVPNEGLKTFNGPLIFAYRDYGYFQFFNEIVERGIISSSTSVAHFCLNLAQYLECSEIILIGQDLSYDSKTFASHSKGIAYSEWSDASNLDAMKERVKQEGLGDVFFVPGNKEEKVPTHSTYFSFMKEFSWEASRSRISVTNSTDGGAKIPLIEWKAFELATSTWNKTQSCFDILKNNYHQKSDSFQGLAPILTFLEELQSKLGDILTLTASPQLFEALSNDKKSEILKSLRLAQTELMKDIRFVSFIIQNAGKEFLLIENVWALREAKNDWNFLETLQNLRSWTELTHSVASEVKQLFEGSKRLGVGVV